MGSATVLTNFQFTSNAPGVKHTSPDQRCEVWFGRDGSVFVRQEFPASLERDVMKWKVELKGRDLTTGRQITVRYGRQVRLWPCPIIVTDRVFQPRGGSASMSHAQPVRCDSLRQSL